MVQNLLRELVDEVEGQPKALEEYAKSRLPRAPKGSIFVGAGDSYAAALAGFYASKGTCLAVDPYTLSTDPQIAKGLEVFFISVSGRTSSNIFAAKRIRKVARKTTALTAEDNSQLASLTDKVVRLPMTYVPRSPGMLSFSLTLLSVLKLVSGDAPCDFREAFAKATKDEGKISFSKGTTYFLGNSLAYPAALYAAAKVYEVLGAKAHAELLEEFSHLELFSLGKTDVVNIFSNFDPLAMSGTLEKALAGHHYESARLPSRGASAFERIFHTIFATQLAILRRARVVGLSRPHFLSAKDRLDVSDRMIY